MKTILGYSRRREVVFGSVIIFEMIGKSFGIFQGEFSGHGFSSLLVGLPLVSSFVIEGIVGVGLSQQALDGQQDGLHLEGRRPVLLQDVEADPAQVVCVAE